MNYLSFQNICKHLFLIIFISVNLLVITACDEQPEINNNTVTAETENTTSDKTDASANDEITIENKSYLFDVSGHSIGELEALLTRAEEVSQAPAEGFEDLEIVMIIHGPDIDWFTQEHYEDNKQLIDLAARLDAYDIIDMKVCEKTMHNRGVSRDDIPSFIESVPYAPAEIEQRLKEGFINL